MNTPNKFAILDDYLCQSQTAAHWLNIAKICDIKVFDRALKVSDQLAKVFAPFHIFFASLTCDGCALDTSFAFTFKWRGI